MNKNKYDKHTYRHTKTKKTCYQNTILTPMVKDPGGAKTSLGNWGSWVFGGGRNSAEAKRRVLVVSFTRSYKQDFGR